MSAPWPVRGDDGAVDQRACHGGKMIEQTRLVHRGHRDERAQRGEHSLAVADGEKKMNIIRTKPATVPRNRRFLRPVTPATLEHANPAAPVPVDLDRRQG